MCLFALYSHLSRVGRNTTALSLYVYVLGRIRPSTVHCTVKLSAPEVPPAVNFTAGTMNEKNNKKRILIIDDDIGTIVEHDALFRNSGVDAEVFVAHWLQEGMEKLKEWAADGHPADIVDSDYYVTTGPDLEDFHPNNYDANNGYNGVSAIGHVMKWAETQPESVRPKKYFLHSKTPDQPWRVIHDIPEMKDKIDVYDTSELVDVASIGDEEYLHASNRASSRRFREYCNKELGARFPMTEAQLKLFEQPDAKIELQDAYYEVADSKMAPEKALSHIDVSTLGDKFLNAIDREKAEEAGADYYHSRPGFERGMGGAMVGCLAFSAEQAHALHRQGKKAILVLEEFTPQDTKLLSVADGIVLLGNGSEHLEVVVANHGIPAVMSNKEDLELKIEEVGGKKCLVNKPSPYGESKEFMAEEGDEVTISTAGTYWTSATDKEVTAGMMLKGAAPIEQNDPFKYEHLAEMYNAVIDWADAARQKHGGFSVKANADTPEQVAKAIELGAEGVGLLRTEHMFFAEERLAALQKALLTDDAVERNAAFDSIKQFQKDDFAKIFEAAKKAEQEFPITIRLLDAPPEEFLSPAQVAALTEKVGEKNMRGVQLAEKTPGLYAMQSEAIFEAAKETGYTGKLEIMIPLIRTTEELRAVKREVAVTAKKYGMEERYQLRAMVETLEAVKCAGEIAKEVSGISFGTNDLTAESMGDMKRDDIAATREWMAKHNHVGKSPFLTLSKPVKSLIQETVEAARKANPAIDIGICGHQVAGDQPSITFCQQVGLDSISVPSSAEHLVSSRIIAGQVALENPRTQQHDGGAKKKSFTSLRKPRTSFAESAPTDTTAPDSNDRDARNQQWDIDKQ